MQYLHCICGIYRRGAQTFGCIWVRLVMSTLREVADLAFPTLHLVPASWVGASPPVVPRHLVPPQPPPCGCRRELRCWLLIRLFIVPQVITFRLCNKAAPLAAAAPFLMSDSDSYLRMCLQRGVLLHPLWLVLVPSTCCFHSRRGRNI